MKSSTGELAIFLSHYSSLGLHVPVAVPCTAPLSARINSWWDTNMFIDYPQVCWGERYLRFVFSLFCDLLAKKCWFFFFRHGGDFTFPSLCLLPVLTLFGFFFSSLLSCFPLPYTHKHNFHRKVTNIRRSSVRKKNTKKTMTGLFVMTEGADPYNFEGFAE